MSQFIRTQIFVLDVKLVFAPLAVLPPVVDVFEEGRSDDAERVEEAHREAEEQGRADAEGQDHRYRVEASTLLLVASSSDFK